MVQVKVLSGKMAGTDLVARHFPFQVGRAAACELSLDDPGIWEKHFQITFDPREGYVLSSDPNTTVIIDGKPVQRSVLRNGDVIEIGLVKILFGLSPTRQRSLVIREWLTWIALAALCLAQVALIYRLLR